MSITLVDKIQQSGSVSASTTTFIEEWYLTGENLIECGDFLRQYRNTPHPDSAAYSVKDISFDRRGEVNNVKQFVATVTYSRGGGGSSPQGEDDNQPVFSFSAGGGTRHVTTGELLFSTASPGEGAPPDPGKLIGWNGQNGQNFHVAGVDVPGASIKESWTKSMKMEELTTAWRRKVANAIGKCNSKTFKGWAKGEVLLVNCSFSGSQDSKAEIQVTFEFSIKMNEENAEVNGVSVGKVEGWQYAWAIPAPVVSGHTPTLAGVYVSQVIEYCDFDELGV